MSGIDRDAILKGINAALKSKKLYPPNHPAIITPVRKTYALLAEAFKTDSSIMAGAVDGAFMFEEDLVEDAEKLYPDLLQYMKERNVDAMIFEKGLSEKELSSLFDILSSSEPLQGSDLQKKLHSSGVTHITLKSVPVGKKNILEVYNGAVEIVMNVMAEIRMGRLPKSEPVHKVVDEITETVFSDPYAMIGLTMIKNYDNYLYNHSVNVSIMALSLARSMNLSKEEIHSVGVGALLHDVGKTGVSENIIRKPSGLSSEEWEKIKEHPKLGSNIAKRMEGLDEIVSTLIYEHHIKYDHSGYPKTEKRLHPLSQIITICDAYDALTTLRVYQQPHNPVEAVKIMSNFSGRHFNPDILKAFVNMMGLYPVGTMVRLSTNEVGVITALDREAADRPSVKILYDVAGTALTEPQEISLAQRADIEIISTVNPAATQTDIGSFFEKEAAG